MNTDNNKGAQTTNGELIASMWEDDGDPEKKRSYLSNLRQDLQNTFNKLKLSGIIVKQRGSMAIDTEKIECDLYDWLEKKKDSKYHYLGDYMNQYSWAEYVHAELDDVPWLREIETCKVMGPDGYAYEPLWVNPLDAESLGLRNGDIAKVFNERGAVLGGVRVTERIRQGVVYMDHGANSDVIVAGLGGLDRGGAINHICPTATSSKHANGEVTSGYLVGVEKVDVFELAARYPDAFARRGFYDPSYGADVRDYLVDGKTCRTSLQAEEGGE